MCIFVSLPDFNACAKDLLTDLDALYNIAIKQHKSDDNVLDFVSRICRLVLQTNASKNIMGIHYEN